MHLLNSSSYIYFLVTRDSSSQICSTTSVTKLHITQAYMVFYNFLLQISYQVSNTIPEHSVWCNVFEERLTAQLLFGLFISMVFLLCFQTSILMARRLIWVWFLPCNSCKIYHPTWKTAQLSVQLSDEAVIQLQISVTCYTEDGRATTVKSFLKELLFTYWLQGCHPLWG